LGDGDGHHLVFAGLADILASLSQATHEPGVMGFANKGCAFAQADLQYVRDTQVGRLLKRLKFGLEVEVNTKADRRMGGFVAPPGWWSWAPFTLLVHDVNYPIGDPMRLPCLCTMLSLEDD